MGAEQALISAQQSREAIRQELFKASEQSLGNILGILRKQVLEAAPATRTSPGRGLNLQLGDGSLIVDPIQMAPANCLSAFGYASPFNVIAYTAIVAHKPRDIYGYEGRSHSLWFCDAHEEGIYRWYELAFMVQALLPSRGTLDPFALPPTDEDAAGAFTPVLSQRQIAWQPLPFDQGYEKQFIERWLAWFAAAVDSSLRHPGQMPENSGGKFRRPQPR